MDFKKIYGKIYPLAVFGILGALSACGSPEPQTVTTTHIVTTQTPEMTPAPMPANPPTSSTTTTTVEKHY